jgi:hypothetical protein
MCFSQVIAIILCAVLISLAALWAAARAIASRKVISVKTQLAVFFGSLVISVVYNLLIRNQIISP